MVRIEQGRLREADMPLVLESTKRIAAGELTDDITSIVAASLDAGAMTVRTGDFSEQYVAFQAVRTDESTGNMWTFRRKPVLDGTRWVVSCASPDLSLETTQIEVPSSAWSHVKPTIRYTRIDKKFQVMTNVENTQGALEKATAMIERSSRASQSISPSTRSIR